MPTSKPEKKEPKKPLSVTHPELAKQAIDWDPNLVISGGGQKLKWKCNKGHIFNATVHQRLRAKKIGECPICIGRQVLIGFNDLKSVKPNLAAEADGWDPARVTIGSGKKARWKCKLGHRWSAVIQSRSNGSGCPVCSNQKLEIGLNDLLTRFPKIAEEADGWDPSKVHGGSHSRVKWKCKKGHHFSVSISSRTSNNSNCPVCNNRYVKSGFNDLATTHPELATEADGWDPSTVIAGSHKKMNWKCPKGHKWNAALVPRTVGVGCPVCAGKKCVAGVNDLATVNPVLAAEAYGWDPATVTIGSGKKVDWKCSKGHLYKSEVNGRSRGRGCPVCRGFSIIEGQNDLEFVNPLIASQAYGWDPKSVTAGSNRRMEWKCEVGHIWRTAVVNRFQGDRQNGSDCPVCTGKKLLVGFNDLLTTHPDLSREVCGWDPRTVSAGSSRKVKWICQLGHKWDAVVANRSTNESGCPYCSGNKVLTGFNDLVTKFPEISEEADGWDPSTVTAGSKRKLKWKCAEGHNWITTVSARTSTYKTSCPSCASTGYDPNEKAWLYLIEQKELKMLQIGITNNPKIRLANHKTRQWELIEIRGPMDGILTRQLEKAILQMLKEKGADIANEKIIGKFEGYSEAWTKATFPVESIKELMRLTDEFEGGLDKSKEKE